MKTLILIFLSINFSIMIYGQEKNVLLSAKVDSIFKEFDKSPGCIIGILEKGEFVHKKGYGLANLEYNIPITSSTVFHMASVSKQFTGFAIHLLKQDGKLSLTDDIRKYLPELPVYDTTITIYNLLYHTSGIRDQWELLIASGTRMDDVITQEHVLNILKTQKELNHKPGTWDRYSNSNYSLLAIIVERVSGKSFAEFTKERIFEPLGMTNTLFLDDHERIIENRAYSYSPDGNGKYKIEHLNFATVGATNLQTTLDDFAKWDRNFYTFELGGEKLMNEYLTKGRFNNGKELVSYASGIRIRDYKGMKMITHSGADAGYASYYFTIPEKEFSLICFSNMGSFWNHTNIRQILDLYLDPNGISRPVRTKPEIKNFSLTKLEISDYLGIYKSNGNSIYKLITENNRLNLQFRNDYNIELTKISKDKLYTEKYGWVLEFERNNKNEIIQFTIDGKQVYKILENKKLLPDQLQQYSGYYHSEEIKSTKQFIVRNGLLYFEGKNVSQDQLFCKGEDVFYTTFADEFYESLSEIKFERNDKGEIVGYYLKTPVVWNLYFRKIKEIIYYK